MGALEAARTLGVAQSNLRTVAGLPEPYAKVASGTLWRAQEIRALAFRRLHKRVSQSPGAPQTDNRTLEEPVA